MPLLDLPIARLDGTPATFGELTGGRPALVVNVASRCGLTPQYTALETLQEKFCSTTYGVTFPMTGKVDVNGPHRHPVYAELVDAGAGTGDGEGPHGDIS